MIKGEFEYQRDLQKPLSSHPNLRVLVDTISAHEIFVYAFLASDLFRLSKRSLSDKARKSILKSVSTGLAELHDTNIIHTDIKPSNILIDYEEVSEGDPAVTQVRISDLEDSVLLPPGSSIGGCLCGNELWQSPESWKRAKQNTSSDIYSLAIVSIYVMLDDMILHAGEAELSGDIAWWHVLRRHISYFGDEEGFRGLLDHIGRENPFHERLIAVAADFDPERPRKPFALWHYVNPDFRDLIGKMARLDPKKRITAREALHHPWFQRGERAS